MAGLGLLACCWLLATWLFHTVDPRRHPDPTLVEFAAAAAGFLCFGAGGALTTLGEHVFDEVEISERWARRPCSRPAESRNLRSAVFPAALDHELSAALARAVLARADDVPAA